MGGPKREQEEQETQQGESTCHIHIIYNEYYLKYYIIINKLQILYKHFQKLSM